MLDKEKLHEAEELFEQCGPFFIALGDQVRQKLILFLADAGLEGINVQNLAAKTHLSRPAISHHLKVLKDAGLVKLVKKGTESFYHICIGEKLPVFQKLIINIHSIIQKMDEDEKIKLFNGVEASDFMHMDGKQ